MEVPDCVMLFTPEEDDAELADEFEPVDLGEDDWEELPVTDALPVLLADELDALPVLVEAQVELPVETTAVREGVVRTTLVAARTPIPVTMITPTIKTAAMTIEIPVLRGSLIPRMQNLRILVIPSRYALRNNLIVKS